MPGEEQVNPSVSVSVTSPSEAFTTYCEAEFERRRNSGEAFDETSYQDAMNLALGKIRALEEEGYA